MTYETLDETDWRQVQRVWQLLDGGDLERAGVELETLRRRRPGHPDIRVVEAALALDEGDPGRALQALEGAERSADPAFFFHLRSVAHYERADLDEAVEDARRALAIRPDAPETHELLGRALEHVGRSDEAEEHLDIAHELDPESYRLPLQISDETFDSMVRRAVDELPPAVRRHLEDVPVLVESLPPREVLKAENPPLSPDLLGLFVGRHLMQRSHIDLPSVPGSIFVFRRNLLRVCTNEEELAREIRTTVRHEVGHLLGLDEDDLEQWGLA